MAQWRRTISRYDHLRVGRLAIRLRLDQDAGVLLLRVDNNWRISGELFRVRTVGVCDERVRVSEQVSDGIITDGTGFA